MKTGKLILWVYDSGGPTEIAAKMGVTRQMIYKWMEGEHIMSAVQAMKFIELSEGKLTLSDLIHSGARAFAQPINRGGNR
jgi:hypothetical protein